MSGTVVTLIISCLVYYNDFAIEAMDGSCTSAKIILKLKFEGIYYYIRNPKDWDSSIRICNNNQSIIN